ncbi:hypothetical protein DFQ26_003912 [Actinomortierella ambigua]|nr:hypothetical protein DFQ26_003912 [Actinomortierella ambigua]
MSDESFVAIGTPFPLPKPNASAGAAKAKPFKDLEVRDEQGRQRFHGAFTGGFSAGYYNTVGSKEGWSPSQFVSSRGKRAEQRSARPEDFMDDEDRELIADSSKLVARDDFDTLGSTQRELERKKAVARDMKTSGSVLGVLPDSLIDDLVVPVSESIGVRLLKQMGWKPGQGIGPRVIKRHRKRGDGIMSDSVHDYNNTPDQQRGEITFAPQDSLLVVFDHKSNHFGLGFDPYQNAPEFDKTHGDDNHSRYLLDDDEEEGFGGIHGGKSKRTGARLEGMSIRGGHFDDDEDEVDVYGEQRQQYDHYEQDVDRDLDTMRRKRRRSPVRTITSKQGGNQLITGYGSDGRPILAGFILAPNGAVAFKWFPPPTIPRDFVPFHKFYEPPPPPRSAPTPGTQPTLTADDRALVLGDDAKIKAPARSIFEYLSKDSKSHLDNVLGFVMDVTGERPPDPDSFKVPKIEREAAEAALKGFMPFGDNLPKQARYKQYLQVQAGILADEAVIQKPEGMTGEGMTKELNEFVQAARIFRPLSGSMANRFTTASKVIEFAQPAAGLRSASEVKASEAERPTLKPVIERMEIPKSQAAKAAAMGMFGELTRTTVDFYPSKLLCKRFNVPNPHPDHKKAADEAVKDLLDRKTMDSLLMNRGLVPPEPIQLGEQHESTSSSSLGGTRGGHEGDINNDDKTVQEEDEEEEPASKDEEEPERPPMDLFKAIFDDSDSDSGSESEEEAPSKPPAATTTTTTTSVPATPGGISAAQQASDGERKEINPVEFRPVFIRRADRSHGGSVPLDTAAASSKTNRAVALLADDEEEDEEDEDFVGPKLSLPFASGTRSTAASSYSTKKASNNKPFVHSSSHKIETADSGPVETASSSRSSQQKSSQRDRSRSASPSRRPTDRQQTTRSDRDRRDISERYKEDYRSSSSSSSRRDREDGDSGGDRRRDRKSSKRHKEDRDRDRDRNRDRDRDLDKKRHRSSYKDRDGDRERKRSSRSKKRERYASETDDMDDMWVEKAPAPMQTPAVTSAASVQGPKSTSSTRKLNNQPTQSRPRAADFF